MWHLTIPVNTWKHLTICIQYLTIPNNTYQYQTNLVSVGIIWCPKYIKYHRWNDTSMIIVLFWYGTDGFVSVWYHQDTNSGNLQINVYLYLKSTSLKWFYHFHDNAPLSKDDRKKICEFVPSLSFCSKVLHWGILTYGDRKVLISVWDIESYFDENKNFNYFKTVLTLQTRAWSAYISFQND